jgi:hypothetical protein
METIARAFKSWFSNNGDLVVCEVLCDCVHVTQLAIDAEGEATIKTSAFFEAPLDFSLVRSQIQKIRGYKKKKFILTFGPQLATTLYTSVSLARENPQEIVNEAELDNLLSQALWKFVDRERLKVAEKMNVSDLDVVLTDVHVRGIRIDGYKVLNPIGFTAKNIGVSFRQTFLTREASEFVRETFPLDRVALIGEAGAIAANVSAADGGDDLLVASIARDATELFAARNSGRSYWHTLAWGSHNLVAYIATELGVSETVASAIMTRYLDGETSRVFKKRLEHVLNNELYLLMKKIAVVAKQAKVRKMFIHTHAAFPTELLLGAPKGLPNCPTLQLFNDSSLGKSEPDNLPATSNQVRQPATELIPLYLTEWQALPVYDQLERLVRRRVQWLTPLATR